MGHIDLACPVAYLVFKIITKQNSLAIDMKLKEVEKFFTLKVSLL